MKSILFLAVLVILSFTACDSQTVEPEIVMATTFDKTATTPTPFPYLQEFIPINSSIYTWWVSNDTVSIKFVNGHTPHAKNYFLWVEHSGYTIFYYLHTIQAFTAIPYIGTSDIENIKLYGIPLE